jgi:hypothetical protein
LLKTLRRPFPICCAPYSVRICRADGPINFELDSSSAAERASRCIVVGFRTVGERERKLGVIKASAPSGSKRYRRVAQHS